MEHFTTHPRGKQEFSPQHQIQKVWERFNIHCFKFSQQIASHMVYAQSVLRNTNGQETERQATSQPVKKRKETLCRAKVFCRDNKGVQVLYQAQKSSIVFPHNIYQQPFHLTFLSINQSVYHCFDIFYHKNVYTFGKAATVLLQ